MGKTRSVYGKKRKLYGNKFHRNIRLSGKAILEMNLACKSTVSSADVIDEVDRLSDAAGPSASTKKIKPVCFSPKVTKERKYFSGFRIMDTELLSKMLATTL